MKTKQCNKCKIIKPISEFTWRIANNCPSYRCKNCNAETRKESYHKNRDIELEKAKKWQKDNPEKVIQYRIKQRDEAKLDVFNHYGNKCVCCGENKLEFLCLDHKNNDGNKQRKKANRRSGVSYYILVRKNNYPKDLQILCYNCNMTKAIYGKCPHKT